MSSVRGLVLGRVKALDDSHRGQVQVMYETEADDQCGIAYDWARVATSMAGADRGEWFMPEVGDEVLIGFANEEAVDPYVLGYVWSEPPGTNATPPKGAAFEQRRLKSKRGHTFTFDDSDANLVELKTNGDHSVTLDDAQGTLVVKGSSGFTVTIDGSKLELKVDVKTVTLDSNGIELKVGGRKIAITPSAIEFT
jgi:uncharacterized protein involved in type VI secretion and phage assembly